MGEEQLMVRTGQNPNPAGTKGELGGSEVRVKRARQGITAQRLNPGHPSSPVPLKPGRDSASKAIQQGGTLGGAALAQRRRHQDNNGTGLPRASITAGPMGLTRDSAIRQASGLAAPNRGPKPHAGLKAKPAGTFTSFGRPKTVRAAHEGQFTQRQERHRLDPPGKSVSTSHRIWGSHEQRSPSTGFPHRDASADTTRRRIANTPRGQKRNRATKKARRHREPPRVRASNPAPRSGNGRQSPRKTEYKPRTGRNRSPHPGQNSGGPARALTADLPTFPDSRAQGPAPPGNQTLLRPQRGPRFSGTRDQETSPDVNA